MLQLEEKMKEPHYDGFGNVRCRPIGAHVRCVESMDLGPLEEQGSDQRRHGYKSHVKIWRFRGLMKIYLMIVVPGEE